MRPKSFALLMLALGCGLVAAIGVHQWMIARAGPTSQPGESVPVFVAVADIGLGESLTPQLVKEERWPKDKALPGIISQIKDIDGRRTRAKLYAGEPIIENKLFGRGDHDQGASAQVPRGYRVVTVKGELVSGGSSLILPGDRVDVMVHLVKDPNRDIPETVTRTILQDIKVFAVNDVLGLENQKDGNKSIVAKTISLLVTPEQAAKTMLASQLGTILFTMRGVDEEKGAPNAEAKPSDLFGVVAKANREKEEQAESPEPKDRNKGSAELAGPANSKPVAEAATVPPRPMWTIRLLKPGAVEDVQMEEVEPGDGPSPFGGWKITTGANAATPSAAAAPESKPEPQPNDSPDAPAKPKPAAKAKDKADKGK
ncbi:MAG: Flp pilus assembly protein CpaB [Thermoguttaceae bacterium]